MSADRVVMRFGRNSINDALDQLAGVERESAEPLEPNLFCSFNFAASVALQCLPKRTVRRSLQEAHIDLDRAIRAELRF